MPRQSLALLITMLLIGCGSTLPSTSHTTSEPPTLPVQSLSTPFSTPVFSITPTAITQPTPIPPFLDTPTPTFQFPIQPASPDQQVQVITDFLNARPKNVSFLPQLFAEWQAHLQFGYYPSGEAIREADIDGDTQPELFVIPPAQSAGVSDNGRYPGLLIEFHHLTSGHYQPKVIYTSPVGALRIWQIRDVTRDGRAEILLQANSCGAHTCFITLTMLQWTQKNYRQIFTTKMSFVEPQLQDIDGDGEPELLLTGGTIGSTGAGVQRAVTKLYAWNGATFELQKTIPDPIASQHPYWKLMDGNTALDAGVYADAIVFYHDALNARPPYPSLGDEGIDMTVVVAAARFQLMLVYLELGKQEQATRIYQEAQQRDGTYAVWTKAFWDSYRVGSDIAAGCKAARQAAHDVYLPGYNYQNNPLGADGAICYRERP